MKNKQLTDLEIAQAAVEQTAQALADARRALADLEAQGAAIRAGWPAGVNFAQAAAIARERRPGDEAHRLAAYEAFVAEHVAPARAAVRAAQAAHDAAVVALGELDAADRGARPEERDASDVAALHAAEVAFKAADAHLNKLRQHVQDALSLSKRQEATQARNDLALGAALAAGTDPAKVELEPLPGLPAGATLKSLEVAVAGAATAREAAYQDLFNARQAVRASQAQREAQAVADLVAEVIAKVDERRLSGWEVARNLTNHYEAKIVQQQLDLITGKTQGEVA